MEIRQATMDDLDGVMKLHRKYHVDTISEEDKSSGFVTTNFTPVQLENLVNKENGVTIATQSGRVVGYAMATSWQFWAEWPFFAHMIKKLPEYTFEEQRLSVENSYQYGPICIDGAVRGSGVFEEVFYASLGSMATRYPIMATFINRVNARSYAAHTRKVHMETGGTFQFNNNEYYLLACATRTNRAP